MENTDISKGYTLSNKMKINLHMLSALMLNWIRRKVDGGDVVAVHHSSSLKWATELRKELT
jgi:hypothetical protein